MWLLALPRPGRGLSCGPGAWLWCSLASISGTIETLPRSSTAVNPCRRMADRNTSYTRALDIGLAETILIVPLTRGSSTKFFPVISLTAFTTPSISALTKLSVTSSGPVGRAAAPAPGRSAGAVSAAQVWAPATAMAKHRKPVRKQ